MTCIAADGWWSLDKERPEQPEPVEVVLIQRLFDGSEGVWVRPLRGPMMSTQLQIALKRLTECK